MVIGKMNNQRELEIVDFRKVDSKGVRNGIIVDLTKVVNSILGLKQNLAVKKINSVFASINGKDIKSHFNRAALNLSPRGEEIRQSHLDKLLNKASSIGLPLNRQIIYRVPLEYIVDGEREIANPLRMTANRIEVRLHIISAKIGEIENLTKSINYSNWEVEGMIPVPLACQCALEQDNHNLLLDIGSQTINAGFSSNNILSSCQFFLYRDNLPKRLEEIKEITEKMDDYDKIDKIVISGGGALTDGLVEKIEEIFEKPTKIGIPPVRLPRTETLVRGEQKNSPDFVADLPVVDLSEEKEIVDNPVYTVATGLVKYGLEKRRERAKSAGIVKRIKRWMEGYF